MTYNHEKFIAQAMDGIMKQKTNFPVEVVVGDDFSTDKTLAIIKQYQDKENIKIKILDRKKGDAYWQTRQKRGRLYNFFNILENCSGEYIALLDGDDFWTDEYKLQKQVDYLESHPGAIGCFHDVKTVDENGKTLAETYYTPKRKNYDFVQNLTELKSAYATCSLVCRSYPFDAPPSWYQQIPCDFTTDILLTRYGTLDYIPENMGAYRIHSGGVWQGTKRINHMKEMAFRYLVLFKSHDFHTYSDYLARQYLYFKRQEMGCYPKKIDKLKIVFQIFRDLSLLSKYPYLFILSLFYSRLRPKSSV